MLKNSVRMSNIVKLRSLRALLKNNNLAAYIIPSGDAHNSEYVSAHDQRRAWISEFDGSAGTVVVTDEKALLWTDGRYYAQALAQLDPASWELMRSQAPTTPTIEDWLKDNIGAGKRVGIDPFLYSAAAVKRLREVLSSSKVEVYSEIHENLVDLVWNSDSDSFEKQPPLPCNAVELYPIEFAGRSRADKLSALRAEMAKENATSLVVTDLADIAWLLNIRGTDVECNPVTIAYAVVTTDRVVLAISSQKLSEAVAAELSADVEFVPYEEILTVSKEAATQAAKSNTRVWIDSSSCNSAIYTVCVEAAAAATAASGTPSAILEKTNPLPLMKAVKNEEELEGMRKAHLKDGIALVSFYAWLEKAVKEKKDMRYSPDTPEHTLTRPLAESFLSEMIEHFRREQNLYVFPSFPSIVGYASNGAVIHYRPKAGEDLTVSDEEMLLVDCGGQFKDGTTDVTRTMHFGTPTLEEKEAYTAVLQGHINLATARFPSGTSGVALDALARSPLWQLGLNYPHGTGHGVGVYLNVHEGPQSIAPQVRHNYTGGLINGMILSNEPGYYEDGKFGIRIENLVAVREAKTAYQYGEKPYLEFENLTVVPIATNLVDVAMMSPKQLAWLNEYNNWTRKQLEPFVGGYVKEFLIRQTEPLLN